MDFTLLCMLSMASINIHCTMSYLLVHKWRLFKVAFLWLSAKHVRLIKNFHLSLHSSVYRCILKTCRDRIARKPTKKTKRGQHDNYCYNLPLLIFVTMCHSVCIDSRVELLSMVFVTWGDRTLRLWHASVTFFESTLRNISVYIHIKP